MRNADCPQVCILPPGASPGPVMVAIKDHPVDLSNGVQLFTYVDSSDRALMELALQVVGLKMTGKLEGARDVAMRIIGNTGSTDDRASMQSAFDPSEFITSASGSQHMPFSSDFEGTIMRFLVMLDHPLADHTPADLPTTQSVLSLKNDQQQGLLHLAAILGFHRLTSFCLSHGADPDIKDRYEMTPLHFAALHGRVTITRVLLQAGASTFIRSRFGRTAYDMAVERDQPDVVSLFPTRIHRRKLSGRAIEDINSRRSSRSSLFSFYTQNEDDSEIDFTPADDDSNASADVSSEEDGEDLEARLSRTPSTVSLSSPGEPGSPTVLKAPLPEEKSSAHVKVGDVAAAYSGWIAKLNEKLPQAALLRPTYTFKSPFTYSPNWAEKLPQFPTNTPQLVRVDHVKAWWHSKSNSAPTAAEPGADRPSLSTFNPPAGHFWRPFDVIRRASFSTTQPPATPPTPTHTYPPPQLSEMQPSEAIRHRLARRLGYVPQDIVSVSCSSFGRAVA